MNKTLQFVRGQLMLGLITGLIAGTCVQGLISHLVKNEPVPNPTPAKVDEPGKIITDDSLLPTISSLARDRSWRTQADFEKRFKDYEISQLPEGYGFISAPPLSREKERYLYIPLRTEKQVINWTPRVITDPKVLSDPNIHPRRNSQGQPIEDVQSPKPETWYLLAAFNKKNDLCNWWCVFVSP